MFSLIVTLAKSIYFKDISEKRAKKTKTTKRSIILLTELKILAKFHNQWVVPRSRSFDPKPPQPKPLNNVNKLVNAMIAVLCVIKQTYFKREWVRVVWKRILPQIKNTK